MSQTHFVVSGASVIGENKNSALQVKEINHPATGLASILSYVMNTCNFHPWNSNNVNNAQTLGLLLRTLADPTSFMIQRGPCNPFSLIFFDEFALNLNFPNWGQAIKGISSLFGYMPEQDNYNVINTISNMAHTAASHPNNGGAQTTLFHKNVFRMDHEALVLYVYLTKLDMEALVNKHNSYMVTHMFIERSIFLFSPEKWRLLAPQWEKASVASFSQMLNKLTTPPGTRPIKLCFD